MRSYLLPSTYAALFAGSLAFVTWQLVDIWITTIEYGRDLAFVNRLAVAYREQNLDFSLFPAIEQPNYGIAPYMTIFFCAYAVFSYVMWFEIYMKNRDSYKVADRITKLRREAARPCQAAGFVVLDYEQYTRRPNSPLN